MHPWLPASPTALSKLAMTEWAVAKERAGSGMNHAVGIRRPMINGLLIKMRVYGARKLARGSALRRIQCTAVNRFHRSEASTNIRLPPTAMLWHP